MKYRLKELLFWVSIFCIVLAVFRRPLGIIFSIENTNAFLVGFYHLFWLVGIIDVLDYKALIPHKLDNVVQVFVVFTSCSLSFFMHIFLIAFTCECIKRFHDRYIRA